MKHSRDKIPVKTRNVYKIITWSFFLLMALSTYLPDVVITFILDGNEKMVSDEMYLDYPFVITAIRSLIWLILIFLGILLWNKTSIFLQIFCFLSIAYHFEVLYCTRKFFLSSSFHVIQMVAFILWTFLHLAVPIIIFLRQLTNKKASSRNA